MPLENWPKGSAAPEFGSNEKNANRAIFIRYFLFKGFVFKSKGSKAFGDHATYHSRGRRGFYTFVTVAVARWATGEMLQTAWRSA